MRECRLALCFLTKAMGNSGLSVEGLWSGMVS